MEVRDRISDSQKDKLLSIIDKGGSTIGQEIPDKISVQGEQIELKQFVFKIDSCETVPQKEKQNVEEMVRKLRRERLQRRQQIENQKISYEEGEAHVDAIVGIDRAINSLENLDTAGLEEKMRQAEIESQREWLSMLKKIM